MVYPLFTHTTSGCHAAEAARKLIANRSGNLTYVGGDNHFTFVSPFDATKGTFGDFVQYANDNGGGASESVTIAP